VVVSPSHQRSVPFKFRNLPILTREAPRGVQAQPGFLTTPESALGVHDRVRIFAGPRIDGRRGFFHLRWSLASCSSPNAMITQAPCPLLDIPTELLVRILSNLSCDDLCLLQGTCRRFKDIIFGTPYLEYLLHTGIDNVDDLLPPDVPFPERVEFLKLHERSWSGLRFNLFSEFSIHDNTRDNVARYTLQNGYLIHSDSIPVGQGLKYKYIDLYSLSSGEEANWVPIRLRVIRPRNIVFAADHNLAVAITFGSLLIISWKQLLTSHSQQGVGADSRYKLHFFEFTTGELHPHALMPVVEVPPTHPSLVGFSQAEVLGDYILTVLGSPQHSSLLSLVSWKTGVVTHVSSIVTASSPSQGLLLI
jgi:hypothetical protein